MPALAYPDQATEIDLWDVRERGVKDGRSPTESFEIDQSKATRVFLVKWEYRHDFVWHMLGYAATWNDGGTLRLSRLLPSSHPDLRDLRAVRASVTGHKWVENLLAPGDADYEDDPDRHHGHPEYQWQGEQLNVYHDAEVTIEYEHASFDCVEDQDVYDADAGGVEGAEMARYVIRGDVTPSGEALQLPGAVFQYIRETGTDPPHNIKIPFNTAKILPQEKFTLTWHRLPANVWTPESHLYERIYGTGGDIAYFGCINTKVFYGRAEGTVLFSGVRPVMRKSPLGDALEWDIEYTFDYDPLGWNNKYYFGTGANAAYNGVYLVGKGSTFYDPDLVPDDYSVYNARDLNKLFSVEAP